MTCILLDNVPAVKAIALERALAAARTGELVDLLAALIAAWAELPVPELAALIARVSEQVRTAPAVRGKTMQARAEWDRRAQAAAPADLPALLDALADVGSNDARKRLWAFTAVADPRIDDALVGLLETVPYRATSTQPFWIALLARLGGVRDPALIARLTSPTRFAGVARTQATWLARRCDELVAALRALPPPPPPPPIVGELAAALARRAPARPADDAALLEAIYAAPDDDTPRLVYADALLERGDPRGELIALQCRGAADRAQQRRAQELVAAHGKTWLGELAPIVRGGYRFERGFVAACTVDPKKREIVARLVGHPAWATVRELAGSARIALDPVMRSLRVLDFDAARAQVAEQLDDAWRELLAGRARAIEALRYTGMAGEQVWDDRVGARVTRPRVDELHALARCAALPRLRALAIVGGSAGDAAVVLAGPIAARLERFAFHAIARDAQRTARELAPALRAAPVATLQIAIGEAAATELVVERAGASYTRARLVVGPTGATRPGRDAALATEAVDLLAALPATIVALELAPRDRLAASERERVVAAARARRIDVAINDSSGRDAG